MLFPFPPAAFLLSPLPGTGYLGELQSVDHVLGGLESVMVVEERQVELRAVHEQRLILQGLQHWRGVYLKGVDQEGPLARVYRHQPDLVFYRGQAGGLEVEGDFSDLANEARDFHETVKIGYELVRTR